MSGLTEPGERDYVCNVRVEATGKCAQCGYYTHDLDLSFECWLCYPACHDAMWDGLFAYEIWERGCKAWEPQTQAEAPKIAKELLQRVMPRAKKGG
jgi:hypothetical protein